MVEKIIYIIFGGFSIYSYFVAPVNFSPGFCTFQFRVYLLVAFYAILANKKRYGTFFNATNIFLSLFVLATYLHSIYYYRDEEILSSFAFGYNQDIVNRAICMAQIGISSYLVGTSFVNYHGATDKILNTEWITQDICRFFQSISMVIASGWFVYIFVFFRRSSTYVIVYPRLTLMLTSVLVFSLVLTVANDINLELNKNGVFDFVKRNSRLFFAFVIFLIPYFYLNSRTNPAAIALIVLMLIHFYYKKLSFKFFLVFGAISFVLMAIVSYSRISDVNTSTSGFLEIMSFGIEFLKENEHSTTFLLQDYMLNIRNLYDGVAYPSSNGYLGGITYLPILFSAIPFLPTLILSLFGYEIDDVDTSRVLTDFNDASYGLGTHIIGDLYMNGGIVAVILGMFILGYIVAMSEWRKSFCWLLVSCSIYGSIMMFPRISFLAWFVMFSMLYLLCLFVKLTNRGRFVES